MATGTLSGRVLVVLYEPRQAEVGDLAHLAVPHQDVGRAQVPVDVVHPLDVRHSRRHLHHTRTGQQFQQARRPLVHGRLMQAAAHSKSGHGKRFL